MSEPVVQSAQRRRSWFGAIIALLAVLTVISGVYIQHESTKRSTCQALFNQDFTVVIKKRAQWADEDKAALNKMLASLLVAKPGTGREILTDYVATTQRTDKLRAENPLPELSDRDC